MKKLTSYLFLIVLLSKGVFAFEALSEKATAPTDNAQTKEKIELGKQLFFDPRLSKTGTVSCNSCHNVMAGGDDQAPTSTGINGQKGGRNSPTVWNAAFQSVQFWDGRAATLEEQAKGPLTNPIEMGMKDHDAVIARVLKIPGYVTQFEKVFGTKNNPVNIDNLAKAIAAYERTLITPNSAYDQYVKGNKKALSAQAKRGMDLVQSVGCVSCHMGPNFSGPKMAPGIGFYQKFPVYRGSEYDSKYNLTSDDGRSDVTKNSNEKNMWRVPTWRNIALTAPYFHNGSVSSLEEAVRVMAKTQLNKTLKDDEVKDIVEFLKALTGKFPKQEMPRLPETVGYTLLN
jgi:cytochrome c peroxidase